MASRQNTTSNFYMRKWILGFSLFIFVYFILLIVANELKYDSVSTGILREFLTLPLLLAGLFLLVLTARNLVVEKPRSEYSFYSFIILLTTTIIMILYTIFS